MTFWKKNTGINSCPEEDGNGHRVSVDFRHMTMPEIDALNRSFWSWLQRDDPEHYNTLMEKLHEKKQVKSGLGKRNQSPL